MEDGSHVQLLVCPHINLDSGRGHVLSGNVLPQVCVGICQYEDNPGQRVTSLASVSTVTRTLDRFYMAEWLLCRAPARVRGSKLGGLVLRLGVISMTVRFYTTYYF